MSELRQALEQAMSSGETDNDDNDDSSVVAAPEGEVTDQLGDEGGQEKDAPEVTREQTTDAPEIEAGESTGEETDDQPKEPQSDPSSKADKPPVGWSPEVREHWAKLPENVRKQVSKREAEVNKVLQDTAEARRLHNDFTKTIEPYRALMVAENVQNPMQAVNGLLETAAALSMGTKQQKAQRLAQLIGHYGVDIETLDSVLAGQQPPQQQQDSQLSPDIEQLINQRLAPYEQERQRRQQEHAYQVKQRAAVSVNEVSQKEFFNDVRMDMADIVELATKRGETITLEQAYDKAVTLNPEIQKVIRTRQSAESMGNRQNAASGINGKRGGVPTGGDNLDLRAQLEQNWNTVATGRT